MSPHTIPDQLPARLLPLMLQFLRRRWPGSVALLILPVTLSFIMASIGDATRRITDAVLTADREGRDLVQAAHGPMLHFAFLMISTIAIRIGMWTSSYHTRMPLIADMRTTLFGYVQRHDPLYFENNLSGKIAHKAATLPDQMIFIMERIWFDFCPAVSFFATASVYFFSSSPWFGAFALCWLAIYFGNLFRVARRSARKASLYNEAKTHLTGRLVDTMTNIKNVITFASNAEEDRRLGEAIGEAKRRHSDFYLTMVRVRIVQHLLNITMWVSLYALGIHAWTHRLITAGDFVMVTTLGTMLINRAQDVGEMVPDFLDNLGSAQESIDTLVVPRRLIDAPGARPIEVSRGDIRFESVSFGYDKGNQIFNNLSLVIPPGQKVGLIGASGAGKSSLVALLLRLHDADGGKILIDGHDIKQVTQDSLRRRIGLIPQDTLLFHRTLLENIRYGDPEAGEAQIIEAAKRAHADEFIRVLPQGYQTLVGERGVKLSGGQRQRIAIARAFLKNAPILILDEATSALDSESEGIIQLAMEDAMRGRTVIAIAHRLSTIAHLDRLIILENGRIVEDGTHAALLARNGAYAQLWKKQSGGFLVDANGKALEEDVLSPTPVAVNE